MAIKFPVIRRKKQPFNRTRYWISNIIWWFYTIIWISVLIFLWYFCDISIWYKLGINFILILGTPALTDLVKPYDKYKKELETQDKENR